MKIRQEESTPIGNYFHDNNLIKNFESLTNLVDEFDVETNDILYYIDSLTSKLKGLKSEVKKVEKAWEKHMRDIDESDNE